MKLFIFIRIRPRIFMRSPHALIPLSGADIFENGSVQQRDEVMPSKRGSYSGVYGVPTSSAPASVSPFHSVAAKFPRLCPPSPPFHSMPPHLLVFSFLPSFLPFSTAHRPQRPGPRCSLQSLLFVLHLPPSPSSLVSFCVCASSLPACRLQG